MKESYCQFCIRKNIYILTWFLAYYELLTLPAYGVCLPFLPWSSVSQVILLLSKSFMIMLAIEVVISIRVRWYRQNTVPRNSPLSGY